MSSILCTGGFGFIGSNFILRHMDQFPKEQVVVLDLMTYAADPKNLETADRTRLAVYRGNIGNEELVANILSAHNPRAIINFAAESHVDRSISGPSPFIQTNINGLATLLDLACKYSEYKQTLKEGFRFLQVGTDEVYGSLDLDSDPSIEGVSPYAPRSPYSASKAAGDHLCMSYYHTFKLPVLLTNCCNNYGPRQHREKFIPTAITSLLEGRKIPVYGKGENIREWLYVDDHCDALELILDRGTIGEQYNIGSPHHPTNLELAQMIIGESDRNASPMWNDNIEFVTDRPGHDIRYALNYDKIKSLGWEPRYTLEEGLKKTISWFKSKHLV